MANWRNLVPSTFGWTWTCPGDCNREDIRRMDLRRTSTELGFGQPSCVKLLDNQSENEVIRTTHSRNPELGKPFGNDRSSHAFATVKQLLNESWNTPLETQLEHERQGLVRTVEHSDGQEGLSAFLEKRSPRFA